MAATDPLARALYEPAEVARLVGLSSGQVNRWLFGYSYAYRDEIRKQAPLVRRQAETTAARRASFLDLIELRAAKMFLDRGRSAQKVRRAFEEVQQLTGEPFLFASRRMTTLGKRFFLEFEHAEGPALLELLTGGQWAIEPVLRGYLEELDYDSTSGLARAWWPLGHKVPVVVEPQRAYGAPAVKDRSIRTATIYDLYLAEGRRAAVVAEWFGLKAAEVDGAVRFEETILSKAA